MIMTDNKWSVVGLWRMVVVKTQGAFGILQHRLTIMDVLTTIPRVRQWKKCHHLLSPHSYLTVVYLLVRFHGEYVRTHFVRVHMFFVSFVSRPGILRNDDNNSPYIFICLPARCFEEKRKACSTFWHLTGRDVHFRRDSNFTVRYVLLSMLF